MLPQNSFFNMAFWVCFSGILGGKIHCFHSDSAETNNYVRFLPNLTTLNTLKSFTSPEHSSYAFILAGKIRLVTLCTILRGM